MTKHPVVIFTFSYNITKYWRQDHDQNEENYHKQVSENINRFLFPIAIVQCRYPIGMQT